jgi:hypothetical protein
LDLAANEFEEPKRSRRALRNTFLGFCSLALVSIKMLVIKLERNEAHDLSVSSIQDTDTSNDYKMAHEQPRAVRFNRTRLPSNLLARPRPPRDVSL